ncbi:hypothetical protein QQ045_020616 [Rhodiola kirilowii]
MDVGEKRAKSGDGDELDRISVLPVHLRESVLECMPIKDAMRTSVLARNWRYCWTGMRKLSFNNMERVSIEVFCRTVDRVLLLHSGPIHKFYIVIPEGGNNGHGNSKLSDWFHVLSKNGIHDILFDAFYTRNPDFPLPSSLFQCRDLKKLVLDSCKFSPPPNFMGFYNLIDLEINYCKVPSHILGSLISQCPLLEKLSMRDTCTEYRGQPLVINALNLKTVSYEDYSWGTVIFLNVPRLAYVSLLAGDVFVIDDMNRPCSSWGFMSSLSLIKDFEFDITLLGPIMEKCPRCLPTVFENLKTLTLQSFDPRVEDDICFVLCLIRSSPGLQDLTISKQGIKSSYLPEGEKSREAAQNLLETEAKEQCKLSNLITVVLDNFDEFSHDIMLAKILLSRCPNLILLKFALHEELITEDVRMQQLLREFEKSPYKDKVIYCERP